MFVDHGPSSGSPIRSTLTGAAVRDLLASENFTLSAVAQSGASGGTTSTSAVGDVNVTHHEAAMVTAWMNVAAQLGSLGAGVTYASLDPGIATVDSNTGVVTPVAAGTARIVATLTGIGTKQQVGVVVTVNVSGSVDVVTGFVTGSMGLHMVNLIAGLIAGKTPRWSTMSNEFMPDYLDLIDAALASAIGDGGSLTRADLSGFTDWS